MDDQNEQTRVCERCGKRLPIMAAPGKHNFCPEMMIDETGGRKIIHVCIDCKVSGNRYTRGGTFN